MQTNPLRYDCSPVHIYFSTIWVLTKFVPLFVLFSFFSKDIKACADYTANLLQSGTDGCVANNWIFSNFLQRAAPLYIRQDGSVGPLRDYSKDDLIRFKVKAGSPSNLPLRVQASSINKACTYHGGWEDKWHIN